MSRLMARMAKTSARVTSRITNPLVWGTTTARAAAAAITSRTLTRRVMALPSRPSEQAGRLHGQDQDHRSIELEVGDLRKESLPEVVGQPDDHAADGRARQAAHP